MPLHTLWFREPLVSVIVLGPTTVKAAVVAEQPAVFLKVKVAVPAATPVTTPALVTVATAVLLLVQVPPLVGDKVQVLPIDKLEQLPRETVGKALTVTRAEAEVLVPQAVEVT